LFAICKNIQFSISSVLVKVSNIVPTTKGSIEYYSNVRKVLSIRVSYL